jgi:selenocysteine lyase/cysteine desulfurase
VFFVTDDSHRYLENFEEREEGGTPDIVGAIRCGLVFQLKEAVGGALIKRQEEALRLRATTAWANNANIAVPPRPYNTLSHLITPLRRVCTLLVTSSSRFLMLR